MWKEGKEMAPYVKNKRKYYATKAKALRARKPGDRIYYDAFEKAYYIIRPKKRKSFWGW